MNKKWGQYKSIDQFASSFLILNYYHITLKYVFLQFLCINFNKIMLLSMEIHVLLWNTIWNFVIIISRELSTYFGWLSRTRQILSRTVQMLTWRHHFPEIGSIGVCNTSEGILISTICHALYNVFVYCIPILCHFMIFFRTSSLNPLSNRNWITLYNCVSNYILLIAPHWEAIKMDIGTHSSNSQCSHKIHFIEIIWDRYHFRTYTLNIHTISQLVFAIPYWVFVTWMYTSQGFTNRKHFEEYLYIHFIISKGILWSLQHINPCKFPSVIRFPSEFKMTWYTPVIIECYMEFNGNSTCSEKDWLMHNRYVWIFSSCYHVMIFANLPFVEFNVA